MLAANDIFRSHSVTKKPSDRDSGPEQLLLQVWCASRGELTTLTNLKLEEYAWYICVTERIGADKREPSFKYACGHILAVRSLRLEQISQGQITEEQVRAQTCPPHS